MKQALYRKYRPKTFDEVFGQDNIVNILKNQIKNDKISHAYIFSGTRGTGKTSTAKIFAKAVNCLNIENGNPCNKCDNCLSVIDEENMDIIEMDAASNRGIDDIRQLRDQVIYPPSTLKYKVYIIDEAHMITRDAFNALLKIMEEPPKHLIFILATTEIEKIPDTILSRTQRFEFKSLSEENIKKQIRYILDKENISMEDRAIEIIANVASGAMRDALSILDQVISIGKEHISTDEVTDLLGIFSDRVKINYARAVFEKDIDSLINIIDEELNKGKDPHNFIKDIIYFFKELIYIKIGTKEDIFDGIVDDISLDQIINTIDLLLEYQDLMKKSDSADLLFRIGSIKIIDYMPRIQLEKKINNLEDRLNYLEKNGVKSDDNNRSDNKDKVNDNRKSNDDLKKDSINDIIQEEKEDSSQKKDDESSGKKNISDDMDSHLDELKNILNEKYPATNLLMDGLVDVSNKLNTFVFYLDEDHIGMHTSMGYFFDKAIDELNKKCSKNYSIKFELYKNEEEAVELENEEDEKIEELKSIFSDNEFNIYDKK